MLGFVKDNILAIISILAAIFGIVIPIYKYLIEKSVRAKELRFRTYHNLIKKLVQPELLEKNSLPNTNISYADSDLMPRNIYGIMLDRQVGVIFELRNYPEYFEVTNRILLGLQSKWSKDNGNERIVREIEYTLFYMEIYMKKRFQAFRFLGFKRLTVFLSNEKTRAQKFDLNVS